jgi:hypothetical protein
MTRNKLLNSSVLGALGLMVAGILVAAQEPPPPAPDVPARAMTTVGMKIVGGDIEFNDKLVKGAPFSAQATTVTDQTLADGNHIHHQNNASLYRDSQGRTRRETTLGGFGPWSATEAETKLVVMINDPVAGVHYMLHPDEHTAIQMPPLPKLPPTLPSTAAGGKAGDQVFLSTTTAASVRVPPPPPDAPPGDFQVFYQRIDREEQSGQTESLGTQVIEGVKAEGTRINETIPAGTIGNDQPIQIVTERWYSPDLQMVVMSKRSDPRVGETTFRLTNINRAEPAATLFQVPADYTLEKAPTPNIVLHQSATETKP